MRALFEGLFNVRILHAAQPVRIKYAWTIVCVRGCVRRYTNTDQLVDIQLMVRVDSNQDRARIGLHMRRTTAMGGKICTQ